MMNRSLTSFNKLKTTQPDNANQLLVAARSFACAISPDFGLRWQAVIRMSPDAKRALVVLHTLNQAPEIIELPWLDGAGKKSVNCPTTRKLNRKFAVAS